MAFPGEELGLGHRTGVLAFSVFRFCPHFFLVSFVLRFSVLRFFFRSDFPKQRVRSSTANNGRRLFYRYYWTRAVSTLDTVAIRYGVVSRTHKINKFIQQVVEDNKLITSKAQTFNENIYVTRLNDSGHQVHKLVPLVCFLSKRDVWYNMVLYCVEKKSHLASQLWPVRYFCSWTLKYVTFVFELQHWLLFWSPSRTVHRINLWFWPNRTTSHTRLQSPS